MKKLIFGLLLAFLPEWAAAQYGIGTPVVTTFASTFTCTSIWISSGGTAGGTPTPTQVVASSVAVQFSTFSVVSSTQTLYRQVVIQNHDPGCDDWCGDSVNVSSQAFVNGTTTPIFRPTIGYVVAYGSGTWTTPVVPGQPIYCVNDCAKATISTVCKGR